MTAKEAAITVLKQAGKPLHLNEITERIISEGLWETKSENPTQSVSTEMQRHSNEDDESSIFRKVAPNTYALRVEAHIQKETPTLNSDSLSFLDAAEKVLDQFAEQKAMHYRDITQLAIEQGWLISNGKTPEQTMNAQLVTHINRFKDNGETGRFMRFSPGLYGLTTWMGTGLSHEISKQNLEVRERLLDHIKQMPPKAVEELAGLLLAEMGFEEVEVTKYNGDHGLDVEGMLQIDDVIRIKMKVQVKRWQHNVQAPVVREIRGSLGSHDQGLIITTSNFSAGAKEEANLPDRTPIALMNGEQLAALLMQYGIGVQHTSQSLFELDEKSLVAIEQQTTST